MMVARSCGLTALILLSSSALVLVGFPFFQGVGQVDDGFAVGFDVIDGDGRFEAGDLLFRFLDFFQCGPWCRRCIFSRRNCSVYIGIPRRSLSRIWERWPRPRRGWPGPHIHHSGLFWEKRATRSPFFTPAESRKHPSWRTILFISFQDMSTYWPFCCPGTRRRRGRRISRPAPGMQPVLSCF